MDPGSRDVAGRSRARAGHGSRLLAATGPASMAVEFGPRRRDNGEAAAMGDRE